MRLRRDSSFLFSLCFILVLILKETKSLVFPDSHENEGIRFRRSAKAFRSTGVKDMLIPANYNVFEPPHTLNGVATKVNVSIIIMSARGINEKDEEITLEMNLRMFWQDERLNHLARAAGNDSFVVLNPHLLQDIWHPDIFIDHDISVSQPSLMTPPASLRIYPESIVRYSARLTVTMACRMMFKYYPLDTQKCPIELKSYAYPMKIMELTWREQKGVFMAYQMNLPNFQVGLDQTRNFTTKTSSGIYSNLEFTISLQRNISYHLIQTYLPSLIFLIVSWLTFLIPKESVPERMAALMMTLLSLTVMFGSVGQNMPKVSYLTALHIWMATTIVFVFLTLLEFAIVLKLWSLEKERLSKKTLEKSKNDIHKNENGFDPHSIDSDMTTSPQISSGEDQDEKSRKLIETAKKVGKGDSNCVANVFLNFQLDLLAMAHHLC